MTHLEQLKAKIQELVPEIMELKFGCEISWQYLHSLNRKCKVELVKKGICISKKHTYKGIPGDCRTFDMVGIIFRNQKTIRFFNEKDLKILGRPITLADVLRAMPFKGITKEGCFIEQDIHGDPGLWPIGNDAKWDLSKTFDDQKPETHKFLYSLFFKS